MLPAPRAVLGHPCPHPPPCLTAFADKPINGFGHGEKALNAAKAVEVIKETNEFYLNLKSGKTDAGKLSLK